MSDWVSDWHPYVFLEMLSHLKTNLIKHLQKTTWEGGGAIFGGVIISFFCEYKPPVKFQFLLLLFSGKNKNKPLGGQGGGVVWILRLCEETQEAMRREIIIYQIPLTPSRVLAPGTAHARLSPRPPSTWADIFWRMCPQSHLQTSLPIPQKSYPKFRNRRTTFESTPLCLPKYSI